MQSTSHIEPGQVIMDEDDREFGYETSPNNEFELLRRGSQN